MEMQTVAIIFWLVAAVMVGATFLCLVNLAATLYRRWQEGRLWRRCQCDICQGVRRQLGKEADRGHDKNMLPF